MTKDTVRFVVDLTIHGEKFVEFERLAQTMIASTKKEIGALGYDWYLSGDRKRCRIVETYKDANAVLAHLTSPVVRELVPKLLEVSSVNAFEVYGDPGAKAAEILAGFGAEIFQLWHGLSH